jgi:hypothetical protein
MTPEEAREVLKDTLLHVDLINLGRTISALGEYGFTWNTFDNSKWRPDKYLAIKDAQWLAKNAEALVTALQVLKQTKS